jgi:hypothetical protein
MDDGAWPSQVRYSDQTLTVEATAGLNKLPLNASSFQPQQRQ